MKVRIDKSIVQKFPNTKIGYIVAKLNIVKSLPYVEGLKKTLPSSLANRGINKQNLASTHYVSQWRQTYKTFGVNPKQFKSSVEALTRRVISGQSVWKISSAVDLYNCCSVLSSFPMGGYDISKLHGDIQLRFGSEGETFMPLGASEPVAVQNQHVIYSDDDRVICWLWNYKDSQDTCIDENTKYAVFFVDSAFDTPDHWSVKDAIEFMKEQLPKIGCLPILDGVLSGDCMVGEFPELSELENMTIDTPMPEIQEIEEIKLEEPTSRQKKIMESPPLSRTVIPPNERPFSQPVLQKTSELADPRQFLYWCSIGKNSELKEILTINPDLVNWVDSLRNSGIHHAVTGGHLSTVEMLAGDFGMNVNTQNKNGYTPLMLAIRGVNPIKDNSLRLVVKLLSYDAQIQSPCNVEGQTALDLARKKGDNEIIRVLETHLKVGAGVTKIGKAEPAKGGEQLVVGMFAAESKEDDLFELVKKGDVKRLQELSDRGVSLDVVDERDNSTLLIEAAKHGNKDVIKFLLKSQQVDVNAKDSKKYSAYMWACKSNNVEIANLIIDAGAQVDTRDSFSLSITMSSGGHNF
jgi:DNA/RNA-binding domain of Phe-tRNA-synthetase-like protein/ankyrin repeat protein